MSPKVNKRQRLRFNNLGDVLRYARRLTHAQNVRQLGKWTPGRAFEHLAKSLNSSIDESQAILPLSTRLVARLLRPIFLTYALPSGFKIESKSEIAAAEFLPSEHISDAAGLRLLEQAIERVKVKEMTARHNLFGKLSQRQWLQLHCRHAELHFGFLVIA